MLSLLLFFVFIKFEAEITVTTKAKD